MMKKSTIQVLTFVGVFVVALGVLYGIQEWRYSNNSGEGADLSSGVYTQAVNGSLIPEDEIYDYGQSAEDLPALTDPTFVSVTTADEFLADEVYGVDVEVGGMHRFYSFQILNWHEVVNDTFGEQKMLVTLCPLCRSAVVYDRTVDGTALTFNSDGRVYNNNVLLRDAETDSLWLQLRGLGVSGKEISTQLTLYPSTTMTWADWKEAYPTGEVLSNETGFDRDYTRHPYSNYDTAETVYFPLNHEDSRITSKWLLRGYVNGGEQIAFVNTVMRGFGVSNETVGEKKIVAFYDADSDSVSVFDPVVGDETLTFSYNFNFKKILDDQTGSEWDANGVAISGAYHGVKLTALPTQESFWMCWSALYPKTKISQMPDATPEETTAEDTSSPEGVSIDTSTGEITE
ncbi:MAG: DUF3179 domain-containing protein [Patescibacteria group bacterium]